MIFLLNAFSCTKKNLVYPRHAIHQTFGAPTFGALVWRRDRTSGLPSLALWRGMTYHLPRISHQVWVRNSYSPLKDWFMTPLNICSPENACWYCHCRLTGRASQTIEVCPTISHHAVCAWHLRGQIYHKPLGRWERMMHVVQERSVHEDINAISYMWQY